MIVYRRWVIDGRLVIDRILPVMWLLLHHWNMQLIDNRLIIFVAATKTYGSSSSTTSSTSTISAVKQNLVLTGFLRL